METFLCHFYIRKSYCRTITEMVCFPPLKVQLILLWSCGIFNAQLTVFSFGMGA